jgi:cytochrome P450
MSEPAAQGGDHVVEGNEAADQIARRYLLGRAWDDPERAAVRATPEPMPMYVELARESPVIRAAESVTLLRMEDILFVNKHHEIETTSKFLGSNRPAIPLGLDGAEHTKYRRLLDPVFSASRIAGWEARVADLAEDLIDTFIERGSVDAYSAWCEPLPSTVFVAIMGLPTEDLDDFLRFKNLTLGNQSAARLPLEEALARREEAVNWIQDYFNRALDEREGRQAPADDMLGWLLTTKVGDEHLSRENVLDILGLLMVAGLDTVAAALACMLSYFARHPTARDQVVADRSIWPSAVEELMRYETPVTDGNRKTNVDLDLPSGERIEAGTRLVSSWSAANLDPAYFEDPLNVDLLRSPNPHVAFASGFHRCLGSHLARMELRTALEVWHRKIPNYSIEPGVELAYSGNPRAPHHLPLRWAT